MLIKKLPAATCHCEHSASILMVRDILLIFLLKRTTFPAHEFKGNQFLTYSPVWHKQKYCSNQMKVPEAN